MAERLVNLAAASRIMEHTPAIVDGHQRRCFDWSLGVKRQRRRSADGWLERAGREFRLQPRESIRFDGYRPARGTTSAAVPAAVLRMERKNAHFTNGHRTRSWYQHKLRIG